MSGTVTIDLPDVAKPQSVGFGDQRNDAVFVSPLSGFVQELERSGTVWTMTLTWKNLNDRDAAKVTAWYKQMGKGGTRCRIQHFGYTRHGLGGGTPLVNGASQTGLSLVTDGWSHSITGIVATGDLIQLATGQLIMATADCNSDSSGNVTIPFEPKLRTSPADDSALTLTAPTALFMLPKKGFSSAWVPSNPAPMGAFAIDLVEDPS